MILSHLLLAIPQIKCMARIETIVEVQDDEEVGLCDVGRDS
jgi:hypothetical protein